MQRPRRFRSPPVPTNDPPEALPPYTVRVSTRARRAQLRVSAHGIVEAVVPRGFDQSLLERFIHGHRDWLAQRVARVEQQRQRYPHLYESPPTLIRLAALTRDWPVGYSYGTGLRPDVRALDDQTLRVRAGDAEQACSALQRWLTGEAKRHLIPWLQRTSAELDLPINRVSIRAQRSRWGSCSAQRNISLNRTLLFLPPEGVRYLFIHELCHTVHMNHSRRFWSLVARFDPDYQRHEALLRRTSSYVPLWAVPDGPASARAAGSWR